MSELGGSFSGAVVLGGERARFEVAGGNHRLIVSFDPRRQIAFVKFGGAHAEYDRLDALTVSQFQESKVEVRVIRNDDDLTAAFAEIETLWGAEPGAEAGDKLDALVALTTAYEDRHYAIPKAPAVEVLKYAMEQAGRSQADLGRLLGSRSRASEILNGRRSLTLDHIRLLAREWRIPAGALIDVDAA